MSEYLIYPLIGFVGTLGTRGRDGTLRNAVQLVRLKK